jgi:hypothetical protein
MNESLVYVQCYAIFINKHLNYGEQYGILLPYLQWLKTGI